MLPITTGEARLVDDPQLRFTASGVAVSNFRLVFQNRKRNDDGTWSDDEDNILWINASCWRQMAENVAESLRKGDLVLVTGKIKSRSYETSDGDKRTVIELMVDEIGPTLRFRSVLHSDGAGGKVTRSSTPDAADPWAVPSEPPF